MRLAAIAPLVLAGCTAPLPGLDCAPWSEPDGNVCSVRPWSEATDPVGPTGARSIEVAVDAEGSAVASWVLLGPSVVDGEVALGEEKNGEWVVQMPATHLTGFGTEPTVATGPDRAALVTWKQQDAETSAVYSSERNADGEWVHPTAPLSFAPNAYQPRPVLSPAGEALVVWNQWTGSGFGVAIAHGTTGTPLRLPAAPDDVVSPPVNFSNAPQIVVASNGDALVTWYQSNGGPLMVYVSERSGPDGEFSRPEPDDFISADGAPVDSHPIRNPVPTLGDRGYAAIAWTQEDGEGAVPVYLALRDGFGIWTTPASLADAFSKASGRAACAAPTLGPEGELYVAWYQADGERTNAYVAYRDPDGEWLEPGDAPTLLNSDGHQGLDPQLAIGPRGEVVVVWIESDGGPWRLAARRRNPGDDAWSDVEVLSPFGSDVLSARVAIGQTGRTVAAWVQGTHEQRRARFASIE